MGEFDLDAFNENYFSIHFAFGKMSSFNKYQG